MRSVALRLLTMLIPCGAVPTACTGIPESVPDLPRFRAGPVVATQQALAADDFVATDPAERWFEVVEGDGVGARILERVQRNGEEIERTEDRDGTRYERMVLRKDADGEIWLHLVERPVDDARSVFLTPLRFALAVHANDAVCRGDAPMEVRSVRNQDEVRAKGVAKRAVRIVGECEVERSSVRQTAVVAEMRFDLVLDIARAEVRVELFVVPGEGIVAERRVERRILFGIPLARSVETVVLSEPPEAAPPGTPEPEDQTR